MIFFLFALTIFLFPLVFNLCDLFTIVYIWEAKKGARAGDKNKTLWTDFMAVNGKMIDSLFSERNLNTSASASLLGIDTVSWKWKNMFASFQSIRKLKQAFFLIDILGWNVCQRIWKREKVVTSIWLCVFFFSCAVNRMK